MFQDAILGPTTPLLRIFRSLRQNHQSRHIHQIRNHTDTNIYLFSNELQVAPGLP